ncbi:MAG: flagellar hook capping FlgD N-terminal domain-containing protein, partial [Ignavibacteriales bacterium]
MAGIDSSAVVGLQNASLAPKPTSSGGELSQVDFMKLIIAQMRNQNPLDPQSDSDFMAQMAQFEALNQMRAVADSMKVLQGVNELSSATSMIGKTVTGRQVDGVAYARDTVAREVFGTSYSGLSSGQRVTVDSDPRVQAAADDRQNAGKEVTGTVDRVSVG